MSPSFVIDQTTREALTKQRAHELLKAVPDGVTSLKLSGKSFGDGSAEVAAELLMRLAPSLTHLDLADIIASRPEDEAKRALATIAAALKSCKHLEYIDLSDNALGVKGINALGDLLRGQTNLQHLFLCNNGLAADAGAKITDALLETTPTSLARLHFHNNLLETAGALALAPILENSPDLEDFRFSSLRLGREGAVAIVEAIQPALAAGLKRLNFSDNTFGEEGADTLSEVLCDAPNLEVLILNDDMLGDEGAGAVCDALVHGAPNLKVLNLSGNEVGLEGAKGLAYLVSNLKLTHLVIEDNELGSSGAVKLAKGITPDCTLEELTVNCCEIGSRGALALATAVTKASSVKKLNIDGNTISAEAILEMERMLEDRLGSLDDNDSEDEDDDDSDEEDEGSDEEDEDESDPLGTPSRTIKEEPEIDDLSEAVGSVGL